MRQYITGLLAKYCDVVACADGAEALAALQARQTDYDLVLSDDMMPRMTGPELLAAVRADAALCAMPFIVLSARAGDDARVDGLARGADDYLAKPFRARELVLRAHAQLQAASTRRRLEARAAAQTRDLAESRGSFGRLCERLHVGVHRSDPTGAVCWCATPHAPVLAGGTDGAQGEPEVDGDVRRRRGRAVE
jgi:DNA-binding response OmpR family regulator